MKTLRLPQFFLLAVVFCAFALPAKSQDKQEDKINAATQVLEDFSKMKESIPADLLKMTRRNYCGSTPNKCRFCSGWKTRKRHCHGKIIR